MTIIYIILAAVGGFMLYNSFKSDRNAPLIMRIVGAVCILAVLAGLGFIK